MKYLNHEQLSSFLTALKRGKNLRDQVIFELMLYLGLRVSELLNIHSDDINFESREIVIQGLKGGRRRTYTQVNEKLMRKLKKYVRSVSDDRLFDISRQGVYKAFRRYVRSAQLSSHFSPHSLRHTTAMLMVKKGQSPFEIMGWLRHRSILSAQVYFENVRFERQSSEMSTLFSSWL